MGKRAALLFLLCGMAGCGPTNTDLNQLKAQWRVEDAQRAAKRRCDFLGDPSPTCADREYQRHVNDPVGSAAEDSKERDRRSNVLLAEWSQCNFQKARELASGPLPAPEAAAQAIAQCDTQREAWVKVQGASIHSQAEYVASQVESTNYSALLTFIQHLRAH